MTGWRARLAALRVGQADAESADSAERRAASSQAEAIVAIGGNGTGMESVGKPDAANMAAFYRQAAEGAAAALAADDPLPRS